jgi:hypothetical protein
MSSGDGYHAQAEAIIRAAIIRAAADWVEFVLEHGDPAVRTGMARFTEAVDDVLAVARVHA